MLCRICSQGEAVSLGRIPDTGRFAGQPVISPIKGGELWKCKACDSLFRYPTLQEKEYLAYYEHASSSIWVGGETWRNDISMINN